MTKSQVPAALLLIAGLMSGCAVGPNYKKPSVNTPTVYRGLTPEQAANPDSTSFAEEKWWDVFQDEQLKELIRTALQQNYDLRRAAARILQAQAAPGNHTVQPIPDYFGRRLCFQRAYSPPADHSCNRDEYEPSRT